MTNQSKFIIGMNGDLARSNQFRVIINPPIILGKSLPEVDRLSIASKSCIDPEDTIGTIVKYKGSKPIQFRGDRDYPPISVDFHYDANMLVHDFLYDWMELLVSHDGFTASRDYVDYTGGLIIEKLRQRQNIDGDSEPEVIKRCYVKGAFPTNIASMGLDDDASNESVLVSVSFAYTSFKWNKD